MRGLRTPAVTSCENGRGLSDGRSAVEGCRTARMVGHVASFTTIWQGLIDGIPIRVIMPLQGLAIRIEGPLKVHVPIGD